MREPRSRKGLARGGGEAHTAGSPCGKRRRPPCGGSSPAPARRSSVPRGPPGQAGRGTQRRCGGSLLRPARPHGPRTRRTEPRRGRGRRGRRATLDERAPSRPLPHPAPRQPAAVVLVERKEQERDQADGSEIDGKRFCRAHRLPRGRPGRKVRPAHERLASDQPAEVEAIVVECPQCDDMQRDLLRLCT